MQSNLTDSNRFYFCEHLGRVRFVIGFVELSNLWSDVGFENCIVILFAGVKGPVRDDLFKSGMLSIIDVNHFFMRANDAVKFYKTGDRAQQEKYAKYIHQAYH